MDGVTMISPTNGRKLVPVSDYLLDDGERLWPVVEDIAYLRPQEKLREAVVEAIQQNDHREALLILLADQDDFSPTAPPERQVLGELIDAPDRSLRAAMDALNYGPVGDYFAYRWCSPTFLSGCRLLELSVSTDRPVVEFACGIGHFLRELEAVDIAAIGVDIVYSKLWLARKFMQVRGALICGDIERSTVVGPSTAGTVFCHDAFYFFAEKDAALSNMRKVSSPGGRLAIGHVHTDRDAHQAGHPLGLAEYKELTEFPVWDDRSVAKNYLLRNEDLGKAHQHSEAVAWVEGDMSVTPRLQIHADGKDLRLNPLVGDSEIKWPSDGWQREYARDARGLPETISTQLNNPQVQRLRVNGVGDLSDLQRTEFFRNQVLLNLPRKW